MSLIVVRLACFRLGMAPSQRRREGKTYQNGAAENRPPEPRAELFGIWRNRCPEITETPNEGGQIVMRMHAASALRSISEALRDSDLPLERIDHCSSC